MFSHTNPQQIYKNLESKTGMYYHIRSGHSKHSAALGTMLNTLPPCMGISRGGHDVQTFDWIPLENLIVESTIVKVFG